MRHVIALTRDLDATQITVAPAFYSTLAASKNPAVAGSLRRADKINQILQHVSFVERISFANTGLESLFRNHRLRSDMTFDSVHLNDVGKRLYRNFLTQLLNRATDSSAYQAPPH